MDETEKKPLLTYSIGAVLFLILTLVMLFAVDPFKASFPIILLFYIFLLLFITSFLTVVLYAIRLKQTQLLPYEKKKIALRESVLLGILIVGSLFLSSRQILYWWVEIIFIATVVLIEGFFLI